MTGMVNNRYALRYNVTEQKNYLNFIYIYKRKNCITINLEILSLDSGNKFNDF